MKDLNRAKAAVLTVGDGRGFVVTSRGQRIIITAAHCLPHFPPCHGASYLEERTYANLLGPLGEAPAVWTECLFADPIADIAVLGSPDDQALFEEAKAYDKLVKSVAPLRIAEAPETGCAWLLSLDGKWFECTVEYISEGPLLVSKLAQSVQGGMSGSPIVSNDGKAIGVVCCTHMNPRLVRDLPIRFLQKRRIKPKLDALP
jgi:trypsin-like peptidase